MICAALLVWRLTGTMLSSAETKRNKKNSHTPNTHMLSNATTSHHHPPSHLPPSLPPSPLSITASSWLPEDTQQKKKTMNISQELADELARR